MRGTHAVGAPALRRLAALLLVVFLAACSSYVRPRMKVLAPIDSAVPPHLYVTTSAERESVLAALHQAGFTTTSDFRESPLVLTVRLGGIRSTRRCGYVRNVAYDLRKDGVRIAVLKGRGWTGSCDPNILYDMSAELARIFAVGSGRYEAGYAR